MTDRVSERRRAAQLARHYRDQEGLTIAEIARRLGRAEGTVKAYRYDPIGARRARSRRAIGASAEGAARRPARATARATRMPIANAAVQGRSSGNGPASGSVRRCAPGDGATALRRPPMTGRAPTHAGAAAKPSNDYRPENGPRRPPCVGTDVPWVTATSMTALLLGQSGTVMSSLAPRALLPIVSMKAARARGDEATASRRQAAAADQGL